MQDTTPHLAKHLIDAHGLDSMTAIRESKATRARLNDTPDERIRRAAPELLDACDEAHQLLWHYDLVMQENGVDWGPVEELRQKMLDRLDSVIKKAREG